MLVFNLSRRRERRFLVGRARAPLGFTLLELLGVVAILAILAAIGLPALLGLLEKYRLDAAANELAGAMRRAQADAVSQGGFYRVHLGSDPAVGRPNSYRIERNSGSGWPTPADTLSTSPWVVTNWVDVSQLYGGVSVGVPVDSAARNLTWITYNSRGAFVDPTGPVTPPATLAVQNRSGAARTITAQYARAAKVQ